MKTWLSAPRCFVDNPDLQIGWVSLSKEEGRHLGRVRRIGAGDRVSVLSGRGRVGLGCLSLQDRDDVRVEIQEVLEIPPARPEITLVIGALKQSAWDEFLKHAVELGVNRIVRVQSDHAVSDVKADKEIRKMQRWRECMIEACKQSANPWLPALQLAGSVAEAMKLLSGVGLQVLASLEGNPQTLPEVLPKDLPDHLVLWIGPEVDFSAAEIKTISSAALPISLGSRILRAETAALALLSHLRLLAADA